MVFKLQLYESVVGMCVEETLEILGGFSSPFKLWRLYISDPWSVYSAKITSLDHILRIQESGEISSH